MSRPQYLSIHPIGDTKPMDMPVADVLKASEWYERCMGFTVGVMDPQQKMVTMRRDTVEIGLAENGGDPEQASCYIEVTDVDDARAELEANYVNVSPIRIDNYGGANFRVFFAKDDDGICYCLGKKIEV